MRVHLGGRVLRRMLLVGSLLFSTQSNDLFNPVLEEAEDGFLLGGLGLSGCVHAILRGNIGLASLSASLRGIANSSHFPSFQSDPQTALFDAVWWSIAGSNR